MNQRERDKNTPEKVAANSSHGMLVVVFITSSLDLVLTIVNRFRNEKPASRGESRAVVIEFHLLSKDRYRLLRPMQVPHTWLAFVHY